MLLGVVGADGGGCEHGVVGVKGVENNGGCDVDVIGGRIAAGFLCMGTTVVVS